MKLFGTDGIRGLFNEEMMDPEMGIKMGSSLVTYCQKRNSPVKIIIGRDTRESGPILEDAIAAGAMSMGADVILAGIIPTPGLAYLIGEQKAGAGIVISASHNPAGYNGLKPFNSNGTKFTDEEEKEMEEYILKGVSSKKIGKDFTSGKKIILSDAKSRYIDFLLKKFPSDPDISNLKLVLDCANGATYESAPAIFGKIIKYVYPLFVSPDGKNINDNCGSQHTDTLRKEVIGKRADLGLAFDGDGDRTIAIDERGNELTGDQIIYIIAKMLKEKRELKNDLVVTTVMSNLGFVGDLKRLGIRHVATDVGDRKVFFEMEKRGAVLGGEEAGHIIVSGFHPAGDGIVGGLMLISAMNYFQKSLSELAGEVTLFPKTLVNVDVKRKPDLDTIPEIVNIIKEVEKKLGNGGRVFVRYSGTENLCRIMIEGRDEKEINHLAQKIAKIISNHLN